MENIDFEYMGPMIKTARIDANMTQDELAERLGVTTRYIMAIENEGKCPALAVPFPSFYPTDLLIGLAIGGLLRLMIYVRSKNAKKYRKGIEYGSARWGNVKDISNFDKVYDKISDEEKKSLISSLIKEIEIFPCDESELPLKSILFNFPVYKDGGDVYERA